MIDALAAYLGHRLVRGFDACSVTPISTDPAGCRFEITDGTGRRVRTRTVVLAVPARVAARLLASKAPQLAAVLDTIGYTDMRVIGLGYPTKAFRTAPPSFGFLSPPGEGLDIMGVSVSSGVFEGQAPPGRTLLRVFAGGAFSPGMVDASTEVALARAARDLRRVLTVSAQPEFVRDVVLRQAIPQYGRRHAETVRQLDRLLLELPGLRLTGNSYRGVGLKDTISEAERLGRSLAGAGRQARPGLAGGEDHHARHQ